MEYFLGYSLLFAAVTAIIAISRGRTGFGWFFIGLVLGIFGLLLVALLPSKKKPPVIVGGEVASPKTHMRCPWCKGIVRRDASVCMHCRKEVAPPVA